MCQQEVARKCGLCIHKMFNITNNLEKKKLSYSSNLWIHFGVSSTTTPTLFVTFCMWLRVSVNSKYKINVFFFTDTINNIILLDTPVLVDKKQINVSTA